MAQALNYPDEWVTLKCRMGLDICIVDDQITIRHTFDNDNGNPVQVSSWHGKSEVKKIVKFLNKFLGGMM